MSLEHDLKATLKRRRPAPDFAARVMAQVDSERKVRKFQAPRWVPWAVAASLLIGGSGGGLWQHQRTEHAKAEKARDQLLIALHVTGVKLDHVRAKVRSIRNEE